MVGKKRSHYFHEGWHKWVIIMVVSSVAAGVTATVISKYLEKANIIKLQQQRAVSAPMLTSPFLGKYRVDSD